MPSVAEQLRAAREAQGLTVHQVAEITKIRTDHIRALEESNHKIFAAPVYIRGFVRTYAALLRLDVNATVAALDVELSLDERLREPPSLVPGERSFLDVLMLQFSKVNWRVALPSLGLAVLLLASYLGYRAWHSGRNRDPLSRLGPGLHQSASPSPSDTLPLPPPPRK
jgi:cytoskeleton protein RodZ